MGFVISGPSSSPDTKKKCPFPKPRPIFSHVPVDFILSYFLQDYTIIIFSLYIPKYPFIFIVLLFLLVLTQNIQLVLVFQFFFSLCLHLPSVTDSSHYYLFVGRFEIDIGKISKEYIHLKTSVFIYDFRKEWVRILKTVDKFETSIMKATKWAYQQYILRFLRYQSGHSFYQLSHSNYYIC